MNKILELAALESELRSLKDQKIVLCHGVFDLLHLGHIRYIEEAKKWGDILVVTITPDEYVNKGPHRPAFTALHRAEAIAALGCVDYVAINSWPTAINTIKLLKPDFYVKGSDYKDKNNDLTGNIQLEEEAVRSVHGEIKFTEDLTFSSSNLLNRQGQLLNEQQLAFINALKQKYAFSEIKTYIEKIESQTVLLVGEVIIDEYVRCDTLGKAGKDPIMTLKRNESDKYAGGVLAIANHLSGFVKQVKVLSYLGDSLTEEPFVRASLADNVSIDFITKSNSPTITKRRYIDADKGSKIIGVYDLNDADMNADEDAEFRQLLSKHLSDYDITIVADYGHGLISDNTVDLMTQKANYLAVNTQLNSANIGFHTISKYSKANYVCMHEGELRHDFRCKNRSVEELAMNLFKRIRSDVITITQGAKGALSYDETDGFTKSPAFASKIVDKIGAGDALFAIASLCNVAGIPADLTLFIGNLAGAEAVASMGNSQSITKSGLLKAIDSILK